MVLVHLPSGRIAGAIRYLASCEEIYDVQVLPGRLRPGILGVENESESSTIFRSEGDWALQGVSEDGRGVNGRSTAGQGVHGESELSAGVAGKSSEGNGVHGTSRDVDGLLSQHVVAILKRARREKFVSMGSTAL